MEKLFKFSSRQLARDKMHKTLGGGIYTSTNIESTSICPDTGCETLKVEAFDDNGTKIGECRYITCCD